jgi:hypothetical protein
MSDPSLLILRRERWKDILERLRVGGDIGTEFSRTKKNNAIVSVYGRKMHIGEAMDLSGIDNEWWKKYEGRDVPEEDIIARLDYQWIKEKTRFLKQGMK